VEAARKVGAGRELIELRSKHLKVMVNVRLELQDAFGREYMRDGSTFAGVLSAVTSVEEPALD